MTAPLSVGADTQMVHFPFAFAAAALVAWKQYKERVAAAALLILYGAFAALVILDLIKGPVSRKLDHPGSLVGTAQWTVLHIVPKRGFRSRKLKSR